MATRTQTVYHSALGRLARSRCRFCRKQPVIPADIKDAGHAASQLDDYRIGGVLAQFCCARVPEFVTPEYEDAKGIQSEA